MRETQYKNFINLSPSPPSPSNLTGSHDDTITHVPLQRQRLDHIHIDPRTTTTASVQDVFSPSAPVESENSPSVLQQYVNGNGNSQRPFEPSDWTVDDPDIASVARYL